MKTVTLSLAAAALFSFAAPANADLWTWSKNSKLEAHDGDSAYRVPTLGLDVRVYEWTPKGSPGYVCIMAFGQTNPVGLQCVEKKPASHIDGEGQ